MNIKTVVAIFMVSIGLDVHAENLTQLRNRIDGWLTNKFTGANGLISRQNAYFAANGKYWQGLLTHSIFPTHTTSTAGDTTADKLTFHPTDQASSWTNFVPEWNGETFAAAAKIDVYDGPAGKGWIVHVFVRFNGVTYERRKTFGPSTAWDFAWRIAVEE